MLTHYDTAEESPTMYFSPVSTATRQDVLADVVAEIRALERRGQVALSSGHRNAAEELFREASALRQRAGGAALSGLPQTFGRLGLVAVHRGDLQQAQDLFELGLDLARAQRPC